MAKKTKVKGIGVDIASIPKIARLIDRYDRETLTMVFTLQEQKYCQSVSDRVALSSPNCAYTLCFAIKEAVSKALGIGFVGIGWHEIEADITQEQPAVCLHGRANTYAQKLGIQQWLVDWWKWQDCLVVNVLAL